MLPVPHTDQVEIRILECVNNFSLGDGGPLWIKLQRDAKTARTRRGPNKSLLVYLHPFLKFTRIDLGHGSGRAARAAIMAANVVLSFNQITFRTGLLLSLSGTRIHYRKHCTSKVTVVSTPVR